MTTGTVALSSGLLSKVMGTNVDKVDGRAIADEFRLRLGDKPPAAAQQAAPSPVATAQEAPPAGSSDGPAAQARGAARGHAASAAA